MPKTRTWNTSFYFRELFVDEITTATILITIVGAEQKFEWTKV